MTTSQIARADEVPVTVRVFTQRFSSTPRGARLARRLALHQLDRWGLAPHGSALSDVAAQIVAELAANAVTHGRVPGRDFELTLAYEPGVRLRIDVADTRTERLPALVPFTGPLSETGRGLLLVAALASRWEIVDRVSVGKTVRAEVDL
ncbi:ATP-binding protein [Streptomyces roseicoloratus]|uniref:ATP-binding protein n=1 Tax=Streptomyces roseicoloratus TaxID=2508722 RepID=A0ABY9RQG8_9ACTN|nr:ATP-binding protein [Streptomyces roseicoloratus]WMX44448.1 ATP-binding protein [Streptomyces roseicoloratus]